MKKTLKISIFTILFVLTSIFPIQFYIFSCEDFDSMLLCIILFIALILPIIAISLIIFFIPKKFKIKKYIAFAVITNIFWWLTYLLAGIPFSLHYQKVNEQKKLIPYKTIVEKINNYKTKHNKYPLSLKEIEIPTNIEKSQLEYKTDNNAQNFYFYSNNKDFQTKYIYCTNEEINYFCKPLRTKEETVSKIDNNWLKYEHDFF